MAANNTKFSLEIATRANLDGINQVKRALEEVKKVASSDGFSPTEAQSMINSANTLQRALSEAYNPKTNVTSIKKFNDALKQSKTNLAQIQKDLSLAGSTGQKAFFGAVNQLNNLNTTIKKTNGFLDKMAQSFGNTLRYQVMNTVINKISGSLSQAYGYVKGLDKSLTNIQIVTEKSSESMKDFAVQANNAAKSLGASTKEYTDASLIYFQQGLDDAAVKNRTDTTMKMANVLGESASQVSDYMTAIWNNFDDGSKSLEYYGDVITKLGAETASSSKEIADGLSKFAAVADTVGLSYEYATAALATVVAETRQSADTIGTAFKTLFARIQGLKLGETLEDGTDLNKYSQALMAVGISIKDQNGQLKDMDTLLDEMGAKWQTLAKDQQVALAQTVAGTRQYTQMVTLMSNWDKVQENIEKAGDAAGTLEQKNSIYMDSLEAHLQVLSTQWEDFFDSMIDADGIKGLVDALTKLAKGFTFIADSLGGLGPILTMLSGTALKGFSTQIANGLGDRINNIKENRDIRQNEAINRKELSGLMGQNSAATRVEELSHKPARTEEEQQELDISNKVLQETLALYQEIYKNKKYITDEDREQIKLILQANEENSLNRISLEEQGKNLNNNVLGINANNEDLNVTGVLDKIEEIQQKIDLDGADIGADISTLKEELAQAITEAGGKGDEFLTKINEIIEKANQKKNELKEAAEGVLQEEVMVASQNLEDFKKILADKLKENGVESSAQLEDQIKEVKGQRKTERSKQTKATNKGDIEGADKAGKEVEKLNAKLAILEKKLADVKAAEEDLAKAQEELNEVSEKLDNTTTDNIEINEQETQEIQEVIDSYRDGAQALRDYNDAQHTVANDVNDVSTALDGLNEKFEMKSIVNGVSNAIGSISQLSSAYMSLSNISNIWANDNLSMGQKIAQSMNALAMASGMVASNWSRISGAMKTVQVVGKLLLSTNKEQLAIDNAEILAKNKFLRAIFEGIVGKKLDITTTEAGTTAQWAGVAADNARTISMLGIVGVILAIIAAVAALIALLATGIWKAHIKQLEEQAAAAEAAARRAGELTKQAQEQAQAIRDLTDAYEELKKSWSDMAEDERRQKAYELCMQYGQQSLAIRALAGDYANLEDELEKLQEEVDNEVLSKGDASEAAYRKAIALRAEAFGDKESYIGSRHNGDDDIYNDTLSLFNVSGKDKGANNWKGSFIRDLESVGVTLDDNGEINVQEFADAAAKNGAQLEAILGSYDSRAAKQLKNFYDQIKDSVTGLHDSIDATTDIKQSNIFKTVTKDIDISTVDGFYSAVAEMAEKAYKEKLFSSMSEATEWALNKVATETSSDAIKLGANLANQYMQANAKTLFSQTELLQKAADIYKDNGVVYRDNKLQQQYVAGYDDYGNEIIGYKDIDSTTLQRYKEEALNQLTSEAGYEEELGTALSKLDKETQMFLSRHPALLKINFDEDIDSQLEELEKEYQEEIKSIGEQNRINTMITLSAQLKSGKPLSNEQLDELFEGGDLVYGKDNVNRDDFIHMSSRDQRVALQQSSIAAQEREYRNKQAGINEATANYEEYEKSDQYQASQKMYDNLFADNGYMTKALNNIDSSTNSDVKGLNAESLEDLAYAYYNAQKGAGALDESQQALIDTLIEEGILTEGEIKNIGAVSNLHRIGTDRLQAYQDAIDEANNKTVDYATAVEEFNQVYEESTKEVDNLQSAFKTLNNAYKEYQENGKLSIDTMQSLLNLSPAYLRYLFNEEGQLELNKDGMVELTKATMRETVATQALTQAMMLKDIADKGAESQYYQQVLAASSAADATGAMATMEMVAARAAIDASEALGEEKQVFLDYANTVIDTIQLMYDNIDKISFDDVIGKSSSKKDKEKKELDDEFDRYYRLKKAISDVENALSDLNKLQSHLSGKQLITSLRMQNDLLKEQKVRYQDLIAEQQKEGAELKGLLSDFGVTFSSDNNISNYGQIATQMLNEYNKAVEDFNAELLDDTAFEIAEKRYDDFKKGLDRYKNLLKEYQDSYDKLDDIYYKELENNLKAWKLEIQLELDTTKMEREWNDFIRNLDKDITLRFQDTDSILEDANFDMGSLAKDKVTEESAMDEIMKEIFNFESNPDYKSDKFASLTEAQEALKDYRQKWMDTLNDIAQARQDAYDAYLQSIDDEAEKISEINNEYDRLADKLSHISKMNELLYGPDNYDTNDKIMQAEASLDRSQMSNFRAQYEKNGRLYEMALEQGDEQAAKKYKDLRDEALDSLYAKEEEYVEKLNDIRSNAAKKITDEYYKALYGMSKDDADREWDKTKALNEGKYDDTQRLYQERTFQNKSNKVIEKASLKYQGKLKDAVEAINKDLQSREELTEYDIQLAEKKLAILEAEAALEDAQNNKNTMKLTRGADGNWSYQYVADESDVADKQQALLDANNEFYELAKSHNEELVEMMNQYYDDYIQRQQELLESGKYTDEEAKKLYDEYYGPNGYITVVGKRYHQNEQDLAEATVSMAVTQYKIDEDSYARMSAEKQRLIDDTKDKNITSLADIVTADADARENILTQAGDLNKAEIEYFDAQKKKAADSYIYDPDSVQNMIEDAMDAAKDAQEDWTQAVDEGCEAAGEDFGDVEMTVEDVQIAVEDLDDATVDMASNAAKALAGYAAAVANLKAQYDGLIGGVRDYEAELQRALQAQAALAGSSVPSFGSSGGYSGGENGTGGSGSSDIRSGPPYVVVAKKTVQGKVYDSRIYGFGKEDGEHSFNSIEDMKDYIQDNSRGLAASDDRAPIVMSKEDFERYGYDPKFSFDTGGYTGSWNDGSGKLAMLHSKELVLNADDTQNMLETVSAVRSLATIGSSITDAIADSIVNIFGGLGNNLAFAGAGSTSNNSVNNFDITMNVDGGDVQAIQEAILSLPNLASQFLSKNLK